MGQLNLPNNFTSLLNQNEDWTKVQDNLDAITTWANGGIANDNLDGNAGITAANLAAAVKRAVGLNDGTTPLSGQENIATSEATTSASFIDLGTPGPSVTVNVPPGGLVEVYATVEIWGASDIGVVGLHEASTFSSGAAILQATGAPVVQYTAPGTLFGVATRVLGSSLVFTPAAAGSQTYKLQYRSTGGGSCAFAHRWLRVRTFLP